MPVGIWPSMLVRRLLWGLRLPAFSWPATVIYMLNRPVPGEHLGNQAILPEYLIPKSWSLNRCQHPYDYIFVTHSWLEKAPDWRDDRLRKTQARFYDYVTWIGVCSNKRVPTTPHRF